MRVRALLLCAALMATLAACSSSAAPDTEAFTAAIATQLDQSAPEGSPWTVACDEVTEVPSPGDVLSCEAEDGDVGDLWTISATVQDDEGNVELDVVRQ